MELEPLKFYLRRRAWWRRYEVMMVLGEKREVLLRFWSWDKADDLVQTLREVRDAI